MALTGINTKSIEDGAVTTSDLANGAVTSDKLASPLSSVNVTQVNMGDWQIKLDGNDIRFVYNGTDMMRLTTDGKLITLGGMSSNGSP